MSRRRSRRDDEWKHCLVLIIVLLGILAIKLLGSIFYGIGKIFSVISSEINRIIHLPEFNHYMTIAVIGLYVIAIAGTICFVINKKRKAADEEDEWFRQAYDAEIARYEREKAAYVEEEIRRSKAEMKRRHMERIRNMSGWEYEQYVAAKLRKNGYTGVEVTAASGDYGADILCFTPEGHWIAVQCKKYNNHPVGVKAVQEIIAARTYYHCDGAMVVGISGFTNNARHMAEETGVFLKTII